jgi:acyl-CoA synthetase (NDP forming)
MRDGIAPLDLRAPSIARLLYPRSVAVYGASRSLEKFGGRVLHNLVRNGFSGALVPINRGGGEVQGCAAYETLADYAGPVDAAVLAVPNGSIIAAAEECAAAGVGAAVVIGTGFAEADDVGKALQDRLLGVCRAGGVRLLGPNCLGAINPRNRMVLTSSISATVGELPPPGRIALVSQSGALMVSTFDYAREAGIPLGPCVSVGNQADIEMCDIVEYLAGDRETDVICIYAEGFVDPARFLSAARLCRDRGIAVILTKAGRTEAGIAAAKSHTASLAGSYAVTAAVCRENGVVLAREPVSMLMAASLISGRELAASDGIALCSGSGGNISIAVDEIAGSGLRLANLSGATQRALEQHVVAGHTQNPIDLGFRLVGNPIEAAGPIMTELTADSDVGAAMLLLGSVPGLESMAKALMEPIRASGRLPVIVVDAGEIAAGAKRAAASFGWPVFPDLDLALRSLRLVQAHAGLRAEAAEDEPPSTLAADAGGALDAALGALGHGHIPEPEAKFLLRCAGIETNPGMVAADADAAAAFAHDAGYPAVLKVASSEIIHKSAIGGVRLNLADGRQVRAAWQEISTALETAGIVSPPRFYIQTMVRGAVAELLVGLRVDPQFGPVVVVASGGVLTEILDDAQIATAPVTRAAAARLLRALRTWPLLARLARTHKVDIEAIVTVIERMSWLAVRARHRLADLEVNPLLVLGDGAPPIAVDARANVASAASLYQV